MKSRHATGHEPRRHGGCDGTLLRSLASQPRRLGTGVPRLGRVVVQTAITHPRMRDYVSKHPEVANAAAGQMERWAAEHLNEGDAPPIDPLLRVLFGDDAVRREQYLRQAATDRG